MNHSYPNASGVPVWSADSTKHAADFPSHCENAHENVPQLVVKCNTSPCRIELESVRVSGISVGSHPDEDSICSDSGFGGSPASLLLRKLSNASSSVLSPASSFEENEDDRSCLDEVPRVSVGCHDNDYNALSAAI